LGKNYHSISFIIRLCLFSKSKYNWYEVCINNRYYKIIIKYDICSIDL
jgi:hypothetical protein